MYTVKYKIKKIKKDGKNKIVPLCRKAIFGFGIWKECVEWEETERQLAEEKYIGLDTDSTLITARKFIDARNPDTSNRFYHE